MKTKIIEATNGLNYGKFLVGVFDDSEWTRTSNVSQLNLLRAIGYDTRQPPLWVFDLQTKEGAAFYPEHPDMAKYQLEKHRIWVCPMYEFFLSWLFAEHVKDAAMVIALDDLPALVDLETNFFAFYGHRRPGPQEP